MNLFRLSGRKVCECVKTKGMLWKGKHFCARFLVGLPLSYPKNARAGLHVGTITSAKLDKSAVKRNRMRRRCREALRVTLRVSRSLVPSKQSKEPTSQQVNEQTSKQSFQLLLLPRSSSLSAPFGELLSDADHLLSHLSARARR